MRPALDPAGHRVPRTKPTCLLHTWRPHQRRPFALVLHLHQHQSSRNLHLHYLAKNQSTQRCQSLITEGSDHPPVLEPHMVLTTHFFFCCGATCFLPHQLVAFRLHVLDFVMVLGEGAVKLRLEHGGVLPGLHELFLQCFHPEHCIAVSLEHIKFLSGSLHDILQQTIAGTWVLSTYGRLTIQGYRQLTFIHYSTWHIASK
jgi:hypothetical protein